MYLWREMHSMPTYSSTILISIVIPLQYFFPHFDLILLFKYVKIIMFQNAEKYKKPHSEKTPISSPAPSLGLPINSTFHWLPRYFPLFPFKNISKHMYVLLLLSLLCKKGRTLYILAWEISMDRAAWWVIVHGVAKNWAWQSTHTFSIFLTLENTAAFYHSAFVHEGSHNKSL